jgi:MFS family permease
VTTGDASFRLRRIALPAYGPTALSYVGQGAVVPVLALAARDTGASVAVAGAMIGLLPVGQIAGGLPAGSAVARWGERRVLVAAAAAQGVAWAIAVLAPALWALAGAVLIAGFGTAAFGLARQVFLLQAVPITMRARAMSTLGGVGRLGLFIGPLLGALVISRWGITAAFVLATVAAFANVPLVLLSMPADGQTRAESDPAPAPVRRVIVDRRHVYASLGLVAFVIAAGRGARSSVVPLWADHVGASPAWISGLFAMVGGAELLLFYPAGLIMDRLGRTWAAVPTVALLGAGALLLPLTASLAGLVVAAIVMAIGSGLGSGIVKTLGADAAPHDAPAQFLAGWSLLTQLGDSSGPLATSAAASVIPLGTTLAIFGLAVMAFVPYVLRVVPRYAPEFVGRRRT